MLRIGITGIAGLIGWHMRSYLYGQGGVSVIGADKPEFASRDQLHGFAASCDAIVHLAGMNRGDEDEVARTNVELTKALIGACETAGSRPHILFSSSTHIYSDTKYGQSKRACTELLRKWSLESGATFTNFVLPNVYGEGGRPFYNSVVSTFCHQLANGETPKIIVDKEIEIVHAQRVAQAIYSAIRERKGGEIVLSGYRTSVSELLGKIREMADLYSAHIIPDLRSLDALDLFNTYRSYLFPEKYPVPVPLRTDQRGTLFEAEKDLTGGQVFISTTAPGITRGNHYHVRKFERFMVIAGKGLIRSRKLFSTSMSEFAVEGTTPSYIDMPAFHAHSITNTGSDPLVTLFYAHEIFDPQNPDTYPETV